MGAAVVVGLVLAGGIVLILVGIAQAVDGRSTPGRRAGSGGDGGASSSCGSSSDSGSSCSSDSGSSCGSSCGGGCGGGGD
jgi:hypothetical protein